MNSINARDLINISAESVSEAYWDLISMNDKHALALIFVSETADERKIKKLCGDFNKDSIALVTETNNGKFKIHPAFHNYLKSLILRSNYLKEFIMDIPDESSFLEKPLLSLLRNPEETCFALADTMIISGRIGNRRVSQLLSKHYTTITSFFPENLIWLLLFNRLYINEHARLISRKKLSRFSTDADAVVNSISLAQKYLMLSEFRTSKDYLSAASEKITRISSEYGEDPEIKVLRGLLSYTTLQYHKAKNDLDAYLDEYDMFKLELSRASRFINHKMMRFIDLISLASETDRLEILIDNSVFTIIPDEYNTLTDRIDNNPSLYSLYLKSRVLICALRASLRNTNRENALALFDKLLLLTSDNSFTGIYARPRFLFLNKVFLTCAELFRMSGDGVTAISIIRKSEERFKSLGEYPVDTDPDLLYLLFRSDLITAKSYLDQDSREYTEKFIVSSIGRLELYLSFFEEHSSSLKNELINLYFFYSEYCKNNRDFLSEIHYLEKATQIFEDMDDSSEDFYYKLSSTFFRIAIACNVLNHKDRRDKSIKKSMEHITTALNRNINRELEPQIRLLFSNILFFKSTTEKISPEQLLKEFWMVFHHLFILSSLSGNLSRDPLIMLSNAALTMHNNELKIGRTDTSFNAAVLYIQCSSLLGDPYYKETSAKILDNWKSFSDDPDFQKTISDLKSLIN
jgi:hypothetical protein